MPTSGHTRRAFRLSSDELWEEFRIATEALGADRSTVLRDFIRWYVMAKGAKRPTRPLPSVVESYRTVHVEPPGRRKSEPDHDG